TVTLTLTRDGEDNYVVGVEYTQLSGSAKEVGVRLLVDTWAGKTDGVPFLTPAGAGNASQIHTHEFKFTPAYSTLWETIDAAGDGYVYLRNTMSGKGLVPPDQIAFARWGSAYRSEWDYSVSSDNTLLGDSAAILWWQPIRVDSGKSRYIATRFGIFKRDEKNIADVQDDKSGFTYLYLERKNESNAPRTYRIEIESPDAALQIPSGNEQTFTLQPQERTVRAVPLTVVGGGEKKITVKEYHDNAKEPLVSSVVVKLAPETGRSANVPIWPNTKPYPVRYISNNGDKKLRCVVKSAV
ncbi:MAG TPA: hypothetical protein PLY93_09935, partial [Turneriella sp.]|nr:hypothetical protein [Turneriella sp.]